MSYDELAALAFVRFNISKDEFLNLTPKEFSLYCKFWNEEETGKYKSDWERTRLIIYYGLEFKRPITYKEFCNTYLPLGWDEIDEPFEVTEELRNQIFNKTEVPTISVPVTDISQLNGLL